MEKGYKIDENGRCVCALERGLIIDKYGNCVCSVEDGYRLDIHGNCIPPPSSECENDDQCADNKFCNPITKTCMNPCPTHRCVQFASCIAINHKAVCQCQPGYTGNPEVNCSKSLNSINRRIYSNHLFY